MGLPMAEEDDSQKTEDPTSKKLEDARKKGQVPVSKEVGNFMLLFGGGLVMTMLARPWPKACVIFLSGLSNIRK